MKPVRIVGPKEVRKFAMDAINVTSSSTTWGRHLSPMLLGPVFLYGGLISQTVENGWQFAKVYPQFVDAHQEPANTYWNWAIKGWGAQWAERYPMGKGAIPLYSLWGGKKLDYIEARKRIYVPLYGDAVQRVDAWDLLKAEYARRDQLVLFDFDGYDHLALGMSLSEVLHDPTRKMGHAFVLAMMLESGI